MHSSCSGFCSCNIVAVLLLVYSCSEFCCCPNCSSPSHTQSTSSKSVSVPQSFQFSSFMASSSTSVFCMVPLSVTTKTSHTQFWVTRIPCWTRYKFGHRWLSRIWVRKLGERWELCKYHGWTLVNWDRALSDDSGDISETMESSSWLEYGLKPGTPEALCWIGARQSVTRIPGQETYRGFRITLRRARMKHE